jgi:protein gp37
VEKNSRQMQFGNYKLIICRAACKIFPIWDTVGSESGPGARPIFQEWVTDIRDQCLGAKVPFFFKQWGGVQKKRAGRTLEGRTWDEMPANLNLVKA